MRSFAKAAPFCKTVHSYTTTNSDIPTYPQDYTLSDEYKGRSSKEILSKISQLERSHGKTNISKSPLKNIWGILKWLPSKVS